MEQQLIGAATEVSDAEVRDLLDRIGSIELGKPVATVGDVAEAVGRSPEEIGSLLADIRGAEPRVQESGLGNPYKIPTASMQAPNPVGIAIFAGLMMVFSAIFLGSTVCNPPKQTDLPVMGCSVKNPDGTSRPCTEQEKRMMEMAPK